MADAIGSGTVVHAGVRAGVRGMEKRTWMAWVRGGERSEKGRACTREMTGATRLVRRSAISKQNELVIGGVFLEKGRTE